MGCCVSTAKPTPNQKYPHIPTTKSNTRHSGISKSPPPAHPLIEEETVKEVLSETHSSIRKLPSPAVKTETPFIKAAPLLQELSRTAKENQNGGACKKPLMTFSTDDLSDASEICSTLSEGVSASTTATEQRDNKDELRDLRHRSPARFKIRSFSGEVNREKTVGRSPGRTSQPSPSRVRPVPTSGYGRRRDSGERSGRRSMSPVTRTESVQSKSGLGRTQSARKTDKSPRRVGSGLGERIRKVDGWKESGESNRPPQATNESLENPLVSLECFIFL